MTSQTTFGLPGRISGAATGEWEERSPWAPLAERRGVKGNAVTSFFNNGDDERPRYHLTTRAVDFLEMIGKSLAYPGANCFSGAVPFSEMMVAVNPICAEIIGREMPNIEDVQELSVEIRQRLTQTCWSRCIATSWHSRAESSARDGRVYATPEPKGHSGLRGRRRSAGCTQTGFHSFGTSLAQTRPIASPISPIRCKRQSRLRQALWTTPSLSWKPCSIILSKAFLPLTPPSGQ